MLEGRLRALGIARGARVFNRATRRRSGGIGGSGCAHWDSSPPGGWYGSDQARTVAVARTLRVQAVVLWI